LEELIIDSWEKFIGLVPEWTKQSWMFRGVTNKSHELIPKIGRPEARHDKKFNHDIEIGVFERFKDGAAIYLDRQPTDDLDWLVVAQHHGLPTRMLDWTTNPLIALYFAVESCFKQDMFGIDSAVYVVLHPGHVRRSAEDPFEIKDVEVIRPKHSTIRISAQSALLTIHPKPDEPYVPEGSKKLIIKFKAHHQMKFLLAFLGIHRAGLFPGLDGLCDHLSNLYRSGILVKEKNKPA
jgi:hypothetical protein